MPHHFLCCSLEKKCWLFCCCDFIPQWASEQSSPTCNFLMKYLSMKAAVMAQDQRLYSGWKMSDNSQNGCYVLSGDTQLSEEHPLTLSKTAQSAKAGQAVWVVLALGLKGLTTHTHTHAHTHTHTHAHTHTHTHSPVHLKLWRVVTGIFTTNNPLKQSTHLIISQNTHTRHGYSGSWIPPFKTTLKSSKGGLNWGVRRLLIYNGNIKKVSETVV